MDALKIFGRENLKKSQILNDGLIARDNSCLFSRRRCYLPSSQLAIHASVKSAPKEAPLRALVSKIAAIKSWPGLMRES